MQPTCCYNEPRLEVAMPDPIRHIVLLLLENQAFDRMLGCFRSVYPELEGVKPLGSAPYSNADSDGVAYVQKPTETKQVTPDPKHEVRFVFEQLQNNNGGFVLDFERNYPNSSSAARQEIMGYHPLDFLPALHTLALEFTICDHWFSSLPGPTWPNRFFALSGTCHGQPLMPEGWRDPQLATYFDQTQDTIFDRLDEADESWRVYYYDFPSSLLLTHQRRPENLAHYHRVDDFYRDCAHEPDFPAFVFIEPKYFGADQNDDHPPPPPAEPPDDLAARIDPEDPSAVFHFDRLGVRVPAVLVSPWVGKRVESTQFDHTSLLKYMTEKWSLGPLGRRTGNATSLSVAIREQHRDDTPAFIRVPYG